MATGNDRDIGTSWSHPPHAEAPVHPSSASGAPARADPAASPAEPGRPPYRTPAPLPVPDPLEQALRAARRRLGPDVTVQRLLILLAVHQHEGLSQRELLVRLESTSVTALSRNLADLSARTSRKTAGPGLLELRVDPMNLRRKTVHLTEAGREVIRDILVAATR